MLKPIVCISIKLLIQTLQYIKKASNSISSKSKACLKCSSGFLKMLMTDFILPSLKQYILTHLLRIVAIIHNNSTVICRLSGFSIQINASSTKREKFNSPRLMLIKVGEAGNKCPCVVMPKGVLSKISQILL